jgi:hypothetical protein
MSFVISELEIPVAGVRHPAMVVTPPAPMVVDRKRLNAVRGADSVNDVEKRILRECEQRKGRCHVAIFRGLFVHSEWGDRECIAMRKGVELAIEEAMARPDADTALVRADVWILKNMLFHFSLPMERIVESVLPPHLRMMHTRLPRVRTLVSELPKASIAY